MTAVTMHAREAGSGLPVVLLHAFPLSSAMWLEQRNELADVCRVITPDLRGFGGSYLGSDEPSLEHMVDDVAELLDGLGLDRVLLGGHSMGGYVAMAFARRHRDRLLGLLLANSRASADTDEARANRERIAGRLDAEASPRVLVDELLPALTGPTTQQERPLVHGRVRALVEAAPPAAAAWAQRAMAARPDSYDALRAVELPSLVLAGDEDAIVPLGAAQEMAAALPGARLVVVRASGHLTPVEQPVAFNAAVRDLVSSIDAGLS